MKKFIISSDVLKPALKKLGQAINEKSVLPVLKNILCKVSTGEVELIASDLEITISCKCMAVTDTKAEPFDILLPFDFINKIVAVTRSAPIVIEYPSAKKAKMIVDNDVYEINSIDKVTDYIKLPVTGEEKTLVLDGDFAKTLAKVMLTTGKDERRPVMTRACLDIKPTESFLVATDAHFLSRFKIAVETDMEEQILISAKMAKAMEGMDSISLSWSDKIVCVKSDNITIWNNRFEDKYPNYQLIIPAYLANLALDKNDLIAALNKACISSIHTKQTTLQLTKETGFICFETDDIDFGRKINVKIPGEFTGNTELIAINAKKLLVMMDQFSSDKVNLHINAATKAMLITADDAPEYLGLLMPLLLDNPAK